MTLNHRTNEEVLSLLESFTLRLLLSKDQTAYETAVELIKEGWVVDFPPTWNFEAGDLTNGEKFSKDRPDINFKAGDTVKVKLYQRDHSVRNFQGIEGTVVSFSGESLSSINVYVKFPAIGTYLFGPEELEKV